MEAKLQQMETSKGITQRWQPSTLQYRSAEQIMRDHELTLFRKKAETCARERWFLLSMKAKYAGMECKLMCNNYYHK